MRGKTPYPYKASSPCMNCKDRHPACHDKCENYISFKKELKKEQDYEKEMAELRRYNFSPRHRQYLELRPNDHGGRKV